MLNRRAVSWMLMTALATVQGHAVAADPKEEARASVGTWLQALDATDYASTWTSASDGFKAAIDRDAWIKTVRAVRLPLGGVKARTEQAATFTHTLPAVPDGDYVVFQFQAAFDQKAQSIETVTAKRDPDGSWKVAGYFIK